MISTTMTSQQVSPARTPPHERINESGGENGPGAPAFDWLLDATRTGVSALLGVAHLDGTSPIQMFESGTPNGHERYQAALREEQQDAGMGKSRRDRLDRTSVDARGKLTADHHDIHALGARRPSGQTDAAALKAPTGTLPLKADGGPHGAAGDFANADAQAMLWYPPEADLDAFNGLVPEHWNKRAQLGTDLGARMSHTFASLLGEGQCSRVLIIGSDCITHSMATLTQALTALATHALVLQPTVDGGYALIGQSSSHAAPFAGIAWGTDTVMAQTRENVKAAGIDAVELPETFDVDTAADLAQLREFVAATSRPHTAAWLERYG